MGGIAAVVYPSGTTLLVTELRIFTTRGGTAETLDYPRKMGRLDKWI
jgi:hypothetical protein